MFTLRQTCCKLLYPDDLEGKQQSKIWKRNKKENEKYCIIVLYNCIIKQPSEWLSIYIYWSHLDQDKPQYLNQRKTESEKRKESRE